MKAIELDFGIGIEIHGPDEIAREVRVFLAVNGLEAVEFEIMQEHGPAGGNPVVRFVTDDVTLRRLVRAYDDGNGEVEYLLTHAEQV